MNKKYVLKVLAMGVVSAFFVSGVVSALPDAAVGKSDITTDVGGEEQSTVLRTDKLERVIAAAEKRGLSILDTVALPNGEAFITVKGSQGEGLIQEVTYETNAKSEQSYTYKAATTPNDPNFNDQWNMSLTDAPTAWDITTGNSDTAIAVIDSGALFTQQWGGEGPYSQPDFPESKLWTNSAEMGMTIDGDACWTGTPEDKSTNDCDDDGNGYNDDWRGWDFMGGFRGPDPVCPNFTDSSTYESSDSNFLSQDNDPQPYSCDSPTEPTALNKDHFDSKIGCRAFDSACFVGHGTMAASVAASATNNNQLIAGVDWQAKVMNLRALDGYGFGSSARVAGAIEYATAMGADVINLSLALFDNQGNCTAVDQTVENALAEAEAAGIVVAAAAGNTGTSGVCYPARSERAIAVGATTQSDERASFSTFGSEVDLVAPGASVPVANAPSAAINTNYRSNVNGTSFSAPHVAGTAGIVKSLFPSMNAADVTKTITRNSQRVASMGGALRTDEYGYGRLDIDEVANVQNTGAYGHTRFIECDGQKYMVERGIRKKRQLTDEAVVEWGLGGLPFHIDDVGCGYDSYGFQLDRVMRSRSTGRVYLVDDGRAHWAHDSAVAETWGINLNKTYPELDSWSILFLDVQSALPSYRYNLGASNIRIFKCDGQEYMVERNIRRKRSMTATALEAWDVKDAFYSPNDVGCTYPDYSVSLDRVIHSRSTGRAYLTDRHNAYFVHSNEAAEAWGLGDVVNQVYPQFDGASIHFLNVVGELPQLAESVSTERVYLVDSSNRHQVQGTGDGDSSSLELIRGDNVVAQAVFSVSLLQTLTSAANVNYAFMAGDDWYLFDYGRTRQIQNDALARWQNFIDGPTFNTDTLGLFAENIEIGYGWQNNGYYYRVAEDGALQRTTSESVAESWGVADALSASNELTNKLVDEQGVVEF